MFSTNIKKFAGANAGVGLLLLVLCISLSINVFLAWQLRQSTTPAPWGVHPRTLLPPIAMVDRNGAQGWIEFTGSQPIVLYVMSPHCGWCKRNTANMIALASAKSFQYRFVGLSIISDGMKDYWNASPLPFPIYEATSTDYLRRFGFSEGTPQTIIVRPGGYVERNWLCAPLGDRQRELEKFFGVRLPGVLEASLGDRK